MLNNTFLAARLQRALDISDIQTINNLMPIIFSDYLHDYAQTLIAYNSECDIKAADLINYKKNNPLASFLTLFMFDETLVKAMCNTNLQEYFANII